VGNGPGQTFLRVYTFSPGRTLISVGGMAQGEEWSMLPPYTHLGDVEKIFNPLSVSLGASES
jgi:hypothetical protein